MKSQYGVLLGLVPVLYLVGYFGFLFWTTSARPASASLSASNMINVHTGGSRWALKGVEIFTPAMRLHSRISGKTIRISYSTYT